jgi:uncharacterized protein (DUF342 family)
MPEYEQQVEVERGTYTVLIQFANHFTECYLTIETEAAVELLPSDLPALLKEHEVTIGLNLDAISKISETLQRGESALDVLVAQGSLPEVGQDAFLEFKTKPFSFEPTFDQSQNGQIDFHQTICLKMSKPEISLPLNIQPFPV